MLSENEKYNNFVHEFSNILYNLKVDIPFSDYIFLCVGSDKIIGDSYGPLVGEKLKNSFKNMYHNIKIYGTLEDPISAVNLEKTVEDIDKKYQHPCIIAIDSALSFSNKIGSIFVSDTKMQFGKGAGKKMIQVGDISIKGVVAKDYKIPRYNFSGLQNTRLGDVIKLADITSSGIYDVIKYR
ncbi:MAG: spore protease YyaC [Clostridia bacterium]|nr:spore protease YyaC [Clostridia bacterium]